MGYFVDQERMEEMVRLVKQAHLFDHSITSLYPERAGAQAATYRHILDVACGPGNWILTLAERYPQTQFTGIDLSERMIEYARMQAEERVLPNVEFHVMDATKPLTFIEESFDLVNLRLVSYFMQTNNWKRLFQECRRVLRIGGWIQATDGDMNVKVNAPALVKLSDVIVKGLWKTGQSFCESGPTTGITAMFPSLLQDAGFVSIETIAHVIDYSAGALAHDAIVRNFTSILELLQPFLVRSGMKKEEIDRLYQQADREMHSEDFRACWFLMTAFGQKV